MQGEYEVEKSAEVPAQSESAVLQAEGEQNLKDVESKEQQYIPRRQYQNQRGGRGSGGRRGNSNGREGRNGGSRGGGTYQNGRSQHHDQPGNYYPRNYHNNRGRGGGKGAGGNSNSHGAPAPAPAPSDL